MKKAFFKLIRITSVFLIGFFVCGSIYAYYLISNEPGPDYPTNIRTFAVIGSSKIDPQTILESLKRGDIDVFRPEDGIPENPQFISPVEWTQTEFFAVATALYHTVWKEPLDDWNLYRMNFFTDCEDNPKGFSEVQLYFFKDAKERKMYSVRAILVNPEYGYVAWGESGWHRPLFSRWKTIDLDKVTIPVENALVSAEAKGGMDFRRIVANECQILVNMNPEVYDRSDWLVMYGGDKKFWIPSK